MVLPLVATRPPLRRKLRPAFSWRWDMADGECRRATASTGKTSSSWGDKSGDDANNLISLAYGNGKFVAAGGGGAFKETPQVGGHILVSTDGAHWRETKTDGLPHQPRPLRSGQIRGRRAGNTNSLWSLDAETWSEGAKVRTAEGNSGIGPSCSAAESRATAPSSSPATPTQIKKPGGASPPMTARPSTASPPIFRRQQPGLWRRDIPAGFRRWTLHHERRKGLAQGARRAGGQVPPSRLHGQ